MPGPWPISRQSAGGSVTGREKIMASSFVEKVVILKFYHLISKNLFNKGIDQIPLWQQYLGAG